MDHAEQGLDRTDLDWFKSAVFYEVLIRSFRDSSGDGVGDLKGLTEKLDYLEWLGIDCLWLPPFFPSPLKDGGYDVADYTAVAEDIARELVLEVSTVKSHVSRMLPKIGVRSRLQAVVWAYQHRVVEVDR